MIGIGLSLFPLQDMHRRGSQTGQIGNEANSCSIRKGRRRPWSWSQWPAAVLLLQAAGLIRRRNGLIVVPLAVKGINNNNSNNNNMAAWCHVTRRIVISHGGRNLETDQSVGPVRPGRFTVPTSLRRIAAEGDVQSSARSFRWRLVRADAGMRAPGQMTSAINNNNNVRR